MTVVCVHLRQRLSVAFPSMKLAHAGLKHPDRLDLSHLAGRESESCNAEYSDSCWGRSRNSDPAKRNVYLVRYGDGEALQIGGESSLSA